VRKLTNKKIKWIIKQLNKGTPVKEIAAIMRVIYKENLPAKQGIQRNRYNT